MVLSGVVGSDGVVGHHLIRDVPAIEKLSSVIRNSV